MAYISTEEVKIIRNKIKNYFPDYKFSISRLHGTSLRVCLMQSDLVFNYEYIQINHYHIDKFHTGKNKEVLLKILELITGVKPCYDRNAGDMGADYGDNNYFIDIQIGKWNTPHKTIKKEIGVV